MGRTRRLAKGKQPGGGGDHFGRLGLGGFEATFGPADDFEGGTLGGLAEGGQGRRAEVDQGGRGPLAHREVVVVQLPDERLQVPALGGAQRPLTEKLSAIVREACEKWAGGVSETATSDVAAAIRAARELAYL